MKIFEKWHIIQVEYWYGKSVALQNTNVIFINRVLSYSRTQ